MFPSGTRQRGQGTWKGRNEARMQQALLRAFVPLHYRPHRASFPGDPRVLKSQEAPSGLSPSGPTLTQVSHQSPSRTLLGPEQLWSSLSKGTTGHHGSHPQTAPKWTGSAKFSGHKGFGVPLVRTRGPTPGLPEASGLLQPLGVNPRTSWRTKAEAEMTNSHTHRTRDTTGAPGEPG
jgi:hypothetical protein